MVTKSLENKIKAYQNSLKYDKGKSRDIRTACRDLEKQLGIEKVESKEYKFLHAISERMDSGRKIDFKQLAVSAGYPRWRASKAETSILRNIDDRLFDAIIGIDRKLIQRELRRMLEQNDDLPAKMRALELASRITGLQDGDATKIQINFPGNVQLAD